MAFFIVETASQFSRALDLARQWRSADVEVVLGGAFIGDCLLRSSRLPSQLQKALDCDVSLFGGDVGQHFDRVLLDAFSGTLSQVYDFSSDLAEALVRDPISVPASASLSLRAWSKDRAGRSLSLFPKLLRRWAHALRAPADRHQVVLMRLADPDGDAGKIMSSDVVVRMRRAA